MLLNRIYIYHHLGLGDHIICNGLVRNFCKKQDTFFLFCKSHNLPSVQFMYRDIPNLKIVSVKDDNEVLRILKQRPGKLIKVGHENLQIIKNFNKCTWDEAFYIQFGIDFKERWKSFYFESDTEKEEELFSKLNPNGEKYCLIHNKDSMGVDRIDYSKINSTLLKIFVEKSDTIFDYKKLIENADEIHCIDSSFKHLVDSLEPKGKLFFHKNYNLRTTSVDDHKSQKSWVEI